jgi:hypothetical protein
VKRVSAKVSLIRDSVSAQVLAGISSQTFTYVTFAYFVIQSTYMAINTPAYLPPDEKYHVNFISKFAHNGISPFLANKTDTYGLGEVRHNPFFLYHYLFGFIYRFIDSYSHAYTLLRFINIIFGILSLFVMCKIAKLFHVSVLIRNMALFILANTLMFVFISAAVSYDNLYNLLALTSIYLTIKIYKEFTGKDFLLLVITLLAGLLIKIGFLPLTLAIGLVLIFRYWRTPLIFIAWIASAVKTRKMWLPLALFIVIGVLFASTFAANLVKYRSFQPACERILTVSQCEINPVYRRDKTLAASPIPRTVSGAAYLLKWSEVMTARTYGVFAHRTIPATGNVVRVIEVLGAIAILTTARYIRKKDTLFLVALFLSGCYVFALLVNNHGSYVRTGYVDLAVQGRYLFAVLPILYLISLHFGMKIFKTNFQKALVCLFLALYFALNCFPTYLHGRNDAWRNFKTIGVHLTVK